MVSIFLSKSLPQKTFCKHCAILYHGKLPDTTPAQLIFYVLPGTRNIPKIYSTIPLLLFHGVLHQLYPAVHPTLLSCSAQGFVQIHLFSGLRLRQLFFHHSIKLRSICLIPNRKIPRNGQRKWKPMLHDDLPIQRVNNHRYRQTQFIQHRFCLHFDFRFHSHHNVCALAGHIGTTSQEHYTVLYCELQYDSPYRCRQ